MANVLKAGASDDSATAARRASGLAGFNLDDLADQGRVRLEECRAEVRRMLDQAGKDAEKIRQQAHAEGYQEGLKQAAVDADTKLKQAAADRARDDLKLISEAVNLLHRTHQEWMQQYANSLSSMALAAAERIVRRQLQREPQLLVQWAEDALTSTRAATRLTLAVHPETLAELGDTLDQMLSSPHLPESTHVVPDESLERGAVVIRQPGGEIQAGLAAQLERLEELLS